MPVEVILLAFSPVFFAFIIYEFVKFRHYYLLKDSLANIALALMHQLSDALALVFLLPLFYWLHQYSLFNIELNALNVLIAFVLQDFLYYWFHRTSHHIHWFWAAHVVHHSSKKMNFTTAFRQSIFYPVVGMWLFWLPMIIIGFEPTFLLMIVAINLAFQFFVHTQIVGKLGWLEHIFNTPSHHRVHHAINKGYIDKNFAGVLIVWDKLFGTFAAERDKEQNQYGIIGHCDSVNPWTISVMQWRIMLKQLQAATNFSEKSRVLFGYPSHRIKPSENDE
ncbi:sterol desaturase family protein [Pseudoalteromonas sp. ASV78]|uniref:sterol desaturase family protein n=2 Tax=Bacteria TaxID=2 RepID=UPI0039FBE58C